MIKPYLATLVISWQDKVFKKPKSYNFITYFRYPKNQNKFSSGNKAQP